MELLAVRQARVLAFLNAEELNPKGRALAHDYIHKFVERYGFLKYPKSPEELLDLENKGYHFEIGKWGEIGIGRVTLFDWGIVIDTTASTEASDGILKDILDWGAENFGMSNRPTLITRRTYVSEIIFTSDLNLSNLNPKVEEIGKRVTDQIAASYGLTLPYKVSGVSLHFDTLQSKQFFSPVRIERLEGSQPSDRKFYSGAPLPTSEHLALIADFEAALR